VVGWLGGLATAGHFTTHHWNEGKVVDRAGEDTTTRERSHIQLEPDRTTRPHHLLFLLLLLLHGLLCSPAGLCSPPRPLPGGLVIFPELRVVVVGSIFRRTTEKEQ